MRLLLIDDHSSFLDTVAKMLGAEPGMEVIGCATGGTEGLHLAADLKPDAVIVDFAMPDVDGPTVTRTLKSSSNPPKVVMMSFHADPEYREMALAAGADAFLTKTSLYVELVPLLMRLDKEVG